MTRTCERTFITHSPAATLTLGQHLGQLLGQATFIALSGDLGSGKTWFSKGVAAGLGVADHEYVNSPAYDLVHEYQGRLPVYHLDLYRLDQLDLDDYLMLQEYLLGDGVCLVEWVERLAPYQAELPHQRLGVQLAYHFDDSTQEARKITLTAYGDTYCHILEQLSP